VSSDSLPRRFEAYYEPGAGLGRFLRKTVARLLLAIYRTKALGLEKLPATGGYILAGNHVSYLDPILLWCVAPRETHFMAKSELFDVPVIGWVLMRVWAFPVNRASADRAAIQRATDLLSAGQPVGMFPEGTRRREPGETSADGLGTAHAGVAFIASRAGVPVIPVGIAGTDRALPAGAKIPRFPRVTISFGQATSARDYPETDRKAMLAAMTAETMRRIASERDRAERV